MRQLLFKLGSILILLLVFFSCKVDKEDIDSLETAYAGPRIISKDVHTLFSDSAVLSISLDAKEQIFLHNDDQEYPKGILVKFFNEDEKVRSTLEANYAYFTHETNIWNVKGNVKVNNLEKQQKLETQEMVWKPKTNDIVVSEKDSVLITEPKRILHGWGLKAKDDFSYYKISKPSGIQFK